jgi:hypothetical protein
MTITQRNIYEGIPAGLDGELIEIIAKNDNVKIEKVVSRGGIVHRMISGMIRIMMNL